MYSQLGQDEWVIEKLSGKRGGTFIDIGAYDGIDMSNSYLLECSYGWTGVCVEANPDVYPQLRTNRNCMTINKAAWGEPDTTVRFNKHYKYEMLSGIALLGDTSVETVTLNQLAAMVGKTIDYISVDTEGSEIEILKAFDMSTYDVRCWTVEHNFVRSHIDWLNAFFEKHGYRAELHKWDMMAWRIER